MERTRNADHEVPEFFAHLYTYTSTIRSPVWAILRSGQPLCLNEHSDLIVRSFVVTYFFFFRSVAKSLV